MKILTNWIIFIVLALLILTPKSYVMADSLKSFANLKGNISISGGTAHLLVVNDFKKIIENYNHHIHILVRGGGSSVGIEQVGKGLVDIGNAGRTLKQKEKQQYRLKEVPFAHDAIAIVVHPSNPLSNIDDTTIRKIFSGNIRNWNQIGGPDHSINVYSRDKNSGTMAMFIKKLLKEPPGSVAQVLDDHDHMKVAISLDRYGIGFMSLAHVDENKLKALSLNDIKPTVENILSGKYQLARKLYMFIPEDSAKISPLTQKFIEYLLSADGRPVIIRNGHIPLNLKAD